MIDRQNIYQLMSGEAGINSISAEDIDMLIEAFPYFQTAWMMKGKAGFVNKSKNFQIELPKIALHVNDRAKLYQFIHASPSKIEESNNSISVNEQSIDLKPKEKSSIKPDQPKANKPDLVSKPKTEKSIQQLIKEKQAKFSQSQNLVSESNDKPIIEEKKDVLPEVIENKSIPPIKLSSKRPYKEIQDEDKEMQENISEVLKWQLEQTKGKSNLKILPDDLFLISSPVTNKRVSNNQKESYTDEVDFIFDFEEDELIELDASTELIESEGSVSDIIEHDEEIELMDDDEVNQLISQNTSAYKLEPLHDEKDDSSKKTDNELITQFIEQEPKIVPRVDFSEDDLEDISASSIEEHEGYITDTLAKIYVQQGKLKKALTTYEKLILKYPEKKAYFTAQIQKIKAKK